MRPKEGHTELVEERSFESLVHLNRSLFVYFGKIFISFLETFNGGKDLMVENYDLWNLFFYYKDSP